MVEKDDLYDSIVKELEGDKNLSLCNAIIKLVPKELQVLDDESYAAYVLAANHISIDASMLQDKYDTLAQEFAR